MKINKLRGKIVEEGYSLRSFSKVTKINLTTLHRRLAGQSEFDRKEIEVISHALSLDGNQLYDIFFAP